MIDFWSEKVWLPSHLTWNDFKSSNWVPTNSDLWITLPLTFLFIIVKILWKKLVGIFLPMYLSKFDTKKSRKPASNLILEKYYTKNGRKLINEEKAEKLANQIGWTSGRVRNWFRLWRNMDLHHVINKFTESSWEFIFYTPAVIYGLYIFSQTNWFYSTTEWFEDWPKQFVPIHLYYYYVLEFSYYLAALISTLLHYQRSDFLIMVFHHFTTLILLFISYNINLLRIGAIIILVHDVSDPFIHISKIMLYMKLPRLTHIFFILFTGTFFISRLILYPCKILYPLFVDKPELFGQIKVYQYGQVLVLALQVMHFVWFYLIMQHFLKYILVGKELRDVRSDGESEDENENDINMNPHNHIQSSIGTNRSTVTAVHEETHGIHEKKGL